ncbi:hypothetical protein BDY19DRAFT_914699 [Irpex rosettiformis]|uniref:Uncharacterized protein n=1 Tax=Irpex rosettiformis TaxID=378272 RepID=A0ACB8UK94_9APHY|nr:hypothetical protein BDY19DRAFT_914699 [Irpex rosettiformis]
MKASQRRYSAAQSVRAAINAAVYQSITEGSHQIDPPKLSPELWDYVSIQAPENRAESERLEFLGDALMDACIAIELYKTIPDGNPHKYTEIRSIVHSNFTFSHIVHKMGLRLTADTKSIGDIFETMIGAYYTEKGFHALHDWMKRSFEPILGAAALAFDQFQIQKTRSGPSIVHPTPVPGSSDFPRDGQNVSPERGKGKRRFSESVVNTSAPTSREDTSASLRQSAFSSIDERSSRIALVSHSSHGDHRTISASQSHDSDLEDNSSESYDSDLEDSGDLPDFWEERHLPDGTTYYIDHTTRSTSWERPRRQSTKREKYSVTESEAAWTARLVAPLPPIPPLAEKEEENTTSQAPVVGNDRPGGPFHPPVIAELLRDGYILEDRSRDEENHRSFFATIPEFCEEVQADDGRTYYIDHPASTILRG